MAAAINANAARGDNSMFGDASPNVSTGTLGGVGHLASGVVDAAKGAGNAVVDTAKSAGNALVDTAKSGFNTVTDLFTPAPHYADVPLPPEKPDDLKQIAVPLPPEFYNGLRPSDKEFETYNAPTPAAPAPAAPAQSQFNSPITPDQFANPNVNYGANVGALGTTYSGFGNLSGVHGVNSSVANSSPTFSSYGAVAPAAPAAPAPQATRGVTISEEEVPASPTTAVSSPSQSWAGAAPSFQGNTATQFADNPTTSMPMSLGYSAAPNVGMQSVGYASMPMSVDYPDNVTIGSQAFGPTFGRGESNQLGIDMVSPSNQISTSQTEADRMGGRGFESNPITGQTDISVPGLQATSYDPSLTATNTDAVSYGGLTPGGASAAINNAVEAGDTTMFGGNQTGNFGPVGDVAVEGNAPEGTGQETASEGAPEGDGGGSSDAGAGSGAGAGDGEKRGGKVGVKRNDTFVNHALKVSSKFGSDAANRSVKKAKAARWTHR